MSKKNKKEKEPSKEFIFQKRNYLFLFIGLAFIALGFILMSGGGNFDKTIKFFNINTGIMLDSIKTDSQVTFPT